MMQCTACIPLRVPLRGICLAAPTRAARLRPPIATGRGIRPRTRGAGATFRLLRSRDIRSWVPLKTNPHVSPGEICAASKLLWKRNLARPTGKNGKTKVVVPFFRRD